MASLSLGSHRFSTDFAFIAMNGIGQLLGECINAFPPTFGEYQRDKILAKTKLQIPMRQLAEKLKDKPRLSTFLNKSLFNGGEVNYLTVKQNNIFHVFLNRDVINAFAEFLEVDNSRKRSEGQMDAQKVVFKYKGINLGELEMRNDTPIHYREIRFNMIKPIVVKLLFAKIPLTKKYNGSVFMYGNTPRKFGRWTIEERKEYNKETGGQPV